jgi:lipopolysaccharide/colanic/teichoic acid biosynthesis glycosyltransferase
MLTSASQCQPKTDDSSNTAATPALPPPVHPGHGSPRHAQKVPSLRQTGRIRPRLISFIGHALERGIPFVPPEGNRSAAYRAAKRAVDLLGAIVLLVLLGPAMLAILLVLSVTTRGKPLYCQRRVGYRGRIFRMFKFRTMQPEAEKIQRHVENELDGPIFKNRRDPRITSFGRLLRKTSLDETPQLLNVLLGPRPLPVHEVAQLRAWQCRRLAVVPGLTCLWQVSGRSEIGLEDWVRMDLWYLRNQSLWTDCKLLLRTPLSVLSGRGAY